MGRDVVEVGSTVHAVRGCVSLLVSLLERDAAALGGGEALERFVGLASRRAGVLADALSLIVQGVGGEVGAGDVVRAVGVRSARRVLFDGDGARVDADRVGVFALVCDGLVRMCGELGSRVRVSCEQGGDGGVVLVFEGSGGEGGAGGVSRVDAALVRALVERDFGGSLASCPGGGWRAALASGVEFGVGDGGVVA